MTGNRARPESRKRKNDQSGIARITEYIYQRAGEKSHKAPQNWYVLDKIQENQNNKVKSEFPWLRAFRHPGTPRKLRFSSIIILHTSRGVTEVVPRNAVSGIQIIWSIVMLKQSLCVESVWLGYDWRKSPIPGNFHSICGLGSLKRF
jgi:hypothetical protein